jgi:hypothetical protein
MRSLRQLVASGLSNPLHNPTLLPDEGMVRRRVFREHRRVLDTQPDDNKPLTYAGYCSRCRVRRVIREGIGEATRREWEEGIGRWCSGGPEGMVGGQVREASGSFR